MGSAARDPLVLEGVSVFSYDESGNASTRLTDVRLTLAPGEWLYVVGVNGSGKSTLARLLAGIYIEGVDGEYQRGFAGETCSPVVLQHPESQLFGETPREEVQFALEWRQTEPERISGIAEDVLRRVGLYELADERWERLSGGQRQAAAFAAAIAGDAPPLVVLDEATAMLDEMNRQAIARETRRLQQEGTAIVWVTQRLDELEPESRVIVMAEGRVQFDGAVREMLFGGPTDAIPPCEQAGLCLPYAASLALQLRRAGKLRGAEVLPVTATEWRNIRFQLTTTTDVTASAHILPASNAKITNSLHIDGLPWRDAGSNSNLKDTGIELPAGTLTLLLGANGAGKTTLLEKLAGLRPPETLRTTYGTESVWLEQGWRRSKLNDRALMKYSYVPQSAEDGLFARSLSEELRYAARPYRLSETDLEARMKRALAAVGWSNEWLSRDPYRMSGGERRRAALAAAFVAQAPWLLLDEPTAGLDGDGHSQLSKYLMSLKESGHGILLVSHDMDWAMPFADRVLILGKDGIVRSCTPEQLLASPEWLMEAGLDVPLWLRIANLIYREGLPVKQVLSASAAASAVTIDYVACEHAELERYEQVDRNSIINSRNRGEGALAHHRLYSFDPRTIWLSYVLLSIGIFAQSTWQGIAVAATITIAALIMGRISIQRWRSLLQGYAIFSVLASAFFVLGAGNGWISFDSEAFVDTLLPFARTYLVLILGLCIPLVMTPLSLRNALQTLLSFKGKSPVAVHRLILTVTIMIRFIPVLIAEWGKFTRIELSRGKQRAGKRWRIVLRMRDLAMPFMLSIFRLGDEIAVALESRGVSLDVRPTYMTKLRWRLRDYMLVAATLLISALMWKIG